MTDVGSLLINTVGESCVVILSFCEKMCVARREQRCWSTCVSSATGCSSQESLIRSCIELLEAVLTVPVAVLPNHTGMLMMHVLNLAGKY